MGKRMKLPFLYHSKSLDPKLSSSSSSSSSPPWPWPACGNINTLSFRASPNTKDDTFRTFNSVFLDTEITPPDSFFSISSSSRSFSTMSEEDSNDPVENVIRGLRSDRLFFDPEQSSSLVSTPLEHNREEKLCSCVMVDGKNEEKEEEEEEEEEEEDDDDDDDDDVAYKKSEILSMESNNPYEDFRRSMEEMVEAHGLKDWEGLEVLLGCYLKINGKNNHGFIVGAFFDLLVSLSFASTSTSSISLSSSTSLSTQSNYSSPSSPLSLPSSSLTSILDHDGNDNDDDSDDGHDDGHVS